MLVMIILTHCKERRKDPKGITDIIIHFGNFRIAVVVVRP